MTARSQYRGHPLHHDGDCWRYDDTGKCAFDGAEPRDCGVCGRGWIGVRVRIPADLSCSGRAKWKRMQIDACLADIVSALQGAGINMRGSCCGHGKAAGYIRLEDGRELVVKRRVAAGD